MLKRIGTRRLMVQDKDREITFQLQLGTKQMQLGEINLLLVNVYLVWLAGNKTTNIKTGEHLSTPFPRFNLTPSLQISVPCPCYHHELHTVPSVRQRMWKGWVMVSTQQFLSAATSFLHFCSTPEWTPTDQVLFWNIHLFQQRVFHRLQWIFYSAMEQPLLLLLSPWCYLWCLSPFPQTPPHSWLFLPFPECASTGDTGLVDRLSCVLQWVHFEARWLWHEAYLGLVPEKSPHSFHLAHIHGFTYVM